MTFTMTFTILHIFLNWNRRLWYPAEAAISTNSSKMIKPMKHRVERFRASSVTSDIPKGLLVAKCSGLQKLDCTCLVHTFGSYVVSVVKDVKEPRTSYSMQRICNMPSMPKSLPLGLVHRFPFGCSACGRRNLSPRPWRGDGGDF